MDDPKTGITRRVQDGCVVGGRLAVHHQSFVVLDGPDAGHVFELEGPVVRVGTSRSNQVRLSDDTVSAHHCEVVAREGHMILRDLGSTNGTRVQGVRVLEAHVEPGAEIALGETKLRFDYGRSFREIGQSNASSFGELVGHSEAMRRVFGLLERVAPTGLSSLVLGETGTGKELAARAIHGASGRAEGPFVVVDCTALNRNLIESELFGYVKGAFTGADQSRGGAFEEADGGTLFLDEIGDLPLDLQPKLLRVLERREVRRIGSSRLTDVDIRIVAATHRDLRELVNEGRFREDLFYRLAEVIVSMPSLGERPEDMPLLVESLLDESDAARLTRDGLDYLQNRSWPGNVRQLRNVLRRAAALAPGRPIGRSELFGSERIASRDPVRGQTRSAVSIEVSEHIPIREARDRWNNELEQAYLERVLSRFGGDINAAAEHMELTRKSVLRLMRQHGLGDHEE